MFNIRCSGNVYRSEKANWSDQYKLPEYSTRVQRILLFKNLEGKFKHDIESMCPAAMLNAIGKMKWVIDCIELLFANQRQQFTN